MNPELRAAMLAQTEARQAVNVLPDEASEEDRTAALAMLNAADQKVAEELAKDPEDRQEDTAELHDRVSLGRYMSAIAEQRTLDGAEAELRQELGLTDQQVPLAALLPTAEERERAEYRADAISPQTGAGAALPSGAINLTTGPMLRRLFTQTDAAFLGISMPAVPPGERRYPVMVAGTTADMVARGAQPEAGAAKFNLVDINPSRLTGRYVFDLEGVAEMGGLLESTLRADLRMEMGYQLDTQLLLGDGQNNEITGVVHGLDLTVPPGAAAGRDAPTLSWANGRQILTDALDGKLRRTEGDTRLLIGNATYAQARTLYRNDDAEIDLIDALRALGGRVRTSFQLPAPAAVTFQGQNNASTKRTQRAIANSEPGAAVAPVWQGITMIRDPYTNAGKAQIVMTAHMLYGFAFRRKDGWSQYGINVKDTAV